MTGAPAASSFMSVPLERYLVSVSLATAWVRTSGQEDIDSEKVAMYSAAMDHDRWDAERHRSDPIKFWDEKLINGNHRLHAVIAYGDAAEMWVLGEPPEGV